MPRRGLGLCAAALVALLAALAAGPTSAQESVVHGWKRIHYAPLDGAESLLFVERFDRAKPTLGDLDGDGDPDLLLGRGDGRVMFFENQGSATAPRWRLGNASISAQMTPGRNEPLLTIDVGDNSAPTLVDFDGDGDLDLFVGSASGRLYFFRNEGNRFLPSFRLVSSDFLGTRLGLNLVVKLPDLNGDGLPDLTLGNEAGEFMIVLNQGTRTNPRYCLERQSSPECLSALQVLGKLDPEDNAVPEWSDFDRDGDLDLFVGKSDGTIAFYRNIGTRLEGTWELAETRFNLMDAGGFAAPAFHDVNGDGVADLLLAGDGETLSYHTRRLAERQFTLWLEDKNVLQVRRLGRSQTRLMPALGDVDGDGDLDLLVGTRGGDLLLYENVGTAAAPAFKSPRGALFPTPQRAFAAPVLADVDGDGDLDLVVGGREGRLELIENTGTPKAAQWAPRSLFFGQVDVGSLAVPLFVDVDGDGDLDLLVGNSLGNIVHYENIGSAQAPDYTLRTPRFSALQVPNNAAPGLFAWNPQGPPDLVLGSQAGTLLPAVRDPARPVGERDAYRIERAWAGGLQAGSYSAPLFADLTGDKRPDLLLGTGPGALLLWRYEGSAKPAQVAAATRPSNTVEEPRTTTAGPGAPGAPDAGTAGESLPLDPIFVAEASALDALAPGRSTKPALFDADGDGRPDLVVGTRDGRLVLYRQGGPQTGATWRKASERFAGYDGGRNAAPTFADIDGDGDLDLVVGNEEGLVLYWENTGSRTRPSFTARPDRFAKVRVGNNAVPAFVDLNGDSRVDLVVGNLKGELAFYAQGTDGEFTLEMRRFIGLDMGVNAAPTFADLTQREVPFLIVGSDKGAVRIFAPTSTSRLRSSGWRENTSYLQGLTLPPGSGAAIADIDGDGDVDLVVGSDKGPLRLFRNHAR